MLLATLSILFAILWLSGKYVLEIKINHENQECISVKSWTILGIYPTRTYPKSILQYSKYHSGQFHLGYVPSVNEPWY